MQVTSVLFLSPVVRDLSLGYSLAQSLNLCLSPEKDELVSDVEKYVMFYTKKVLSACFWMKAWKSSDCYIWSWMPLGRAMAQDHSSYYGEHSFYWTAHSCGLDLYVTHQKRFSLSPLNYSINFKILAYVSNVDQQ